jgi:exonuclease III
MEHHLNAMELRHVNLENYTIGAQFCSALYKQGGVVIYTHNSLNSTNIDLTKYCKEKYIETCAVKLNFNSIVCIMTIYRSPSGNSNYFFQSLDKVLQILYTPVLSIIICGDININYLVDNDQRKKLDNLLLLHNFIGTVNFPTRHNYTFSSATDDVFIDISHFHDYSLIPFSNDLSNHDAQILIIKTLYKSQSER